MPRVSTASTTATAIAVLCGRRRRFTYGFGILVHLGGSPLPHGVPYRYRRRDCLFVGAALPGFGHVEIQAGLAVGSDGRSDGDQFLGLMVHGVVPFIHCCCGWTICLLVGILWRAARVDGVGDAAHRGRQFRTTGRVADLLAALLGLDQACVAEQRKMARDDGDVRWIAFGGLAARNGGSPGRVIHQSPQNARDFYVFVDSA